jgi:adenosylcobinamide kinase / adenosylcobinamide-phosphate guanylyltransferase
MGFTFLTGGARSGKSSLAVRLAQKAADQTGAPVIFIATAEALDEEMRHRIDLHQRERKSDWATIEAPHELEAAIASTPSNAFLIVDCLSLWVSNLMLTDVPHLHQQAHSAAELMATRNGAVVTNEVGLGIVPDNALARRYRDELGRVNVVFATAATDRFLVVAGHTLRLEVPPA